MARVTNLDPKSKLHNRTDASRFSSPDESSTKIHSKYTIKQQEFVWKLLPLIFLHSLYHGYGAFFWRIRTLFSFRFVERNTAKRAFNNYVDQNLPNFAPPPSSRQKWTFYILNTHCHMTRRGLSTDPPPPSSCPCSFWMSL